MRDEIFEVIRKIDDGVYGDARHFYANTYDYEDGQILVFDDWDSVRFMEKILHEIVKDEEDYNKRRESEYDTSALDYMTEGGNLWTFSDEGFVCDDCYKWKFYMERNACSYANYKVGDGYIICDSCICSCKENKEEYIRDMIDDPKSANTILDYSDLLELGFDKVNDWPYANGWYGRSAEPKKILERAKANDANAEYLFSIKKTYNPWEVEFDLYKREKENEYEH